MSKTVIGVVLVSLLCTSSAFSQQMQDVVYLNDGSVIRGLIIEQVPGVSVTIKTRDGSIFVYKMADVMKMTKEPAMPGAGVVMGTPPKSPGLAFALSFLVVGLGQHYNGEHVKGIIQEVMVIGGCVMVFGAGLSEAEYWDPYWGYYYWDRELTPWFWIGLGDIMVASIWSVIDAPLSAARINRELGYGHMIEFKNSRYALGLDAGPANEGVGIKATLHF